MIYGVHTDYTPPRKFTAIFDNRCLDYQGDIEIKRGDVVLVSAILSDGTGVANINGFNRLIDMKYYKEGLWVSGKRLQCVLSGKYTGEEDGINTLVKDKKEE